MANSWYDPATLLSGIATWVTVTVNRATSQDSKLFPDPELFIPERYLASDKDSLAMDPRRFSFGYGRHLCPWMDFADMNIFLVISALLATSANSNAFNDDGTPIIPDTRSTDGPLRRVSTFSSIC